MILQGRAFGTEAFEILNDSLDSTVSASGFAVVELIYMNFSKSVVLRDIDTLLVLALMGLSPTVVIDGQR